MFSAALSSAWNSLPAIFQSLETYFQALEFRFASMSDNGHTVRPFYVYQLRRKPMKRIVVVLLLTLSALCLTTRAADVDQLIKQANSPKGYKPLFNKNLSNATFTENMWQFQDGVLKPTPERVKKPAPKPSPAGQKGNKKKKRKGPKIPRDIWSKDRYGNFIVDLEFKCEEKTNSGVFIRTDDTVQWLHTGMEVQIMQQPGKTPRNSIGAVYDCKAADKEPNIKPVGEWNRYTIIAKDNWIHIMLNGKLVNSMNLDRWTEAGKNPDGSKNKFKTAYKDMAREGHIGLQFHGQPIWFRNVRVKTL
jgi:hypothetical protein